jgi:hypothetical protein
MHKLFWSKCLEKISHFRHLDRGGSTEYGEIKCKRVCWIKLAEDAVWWYICECGNEPLVLGNFSTN